MLQNRHSWKKAKLIQFNIKLNTKQESCNQPTELQYVCVCKNIILKPRMICYGILGDFRFTDTYTILVALSTPTNRSNERNKAIS